MPHSSGGGSHGGGSFHGSFRSSGSGASAEKPISNKPYVGARRYIYYDRAGIYHSLYYQGTPSKPKLSTAIISIIILCAFLVPILGMTLASAFVTPQKVDIASYNANIVVDDQLELADDEKLKEAFGAFQELTGVTPAMEIVSHDAWKNYSNLETYAYSEYLRLFDDEKHWLFIVSYPTDINEVDFVDWSWQGMIGDEVYPAIPENQEERFTDIFQKYMLRSEPGTVGESMIAALDEFSVGLMEPSISVGFIIASVVAVLIFVLLVYAIIHDYQNHKQLAGAVPVSDEVQEKRCEYCGGTYVVGTIHTCPRCGAPIPPKD